jgi:CHAT domain-containing protein
MRRVMLFVGLIAALAIGGGGKASAQQQGIATLTHRIKLDADWVVLSACYTAAGESDKLDLGSLSGLARAVLCWSASLAWW